MKQQLMKQQLMSDNASPPSRFLVREGSKGWMVYDRQRKGPAMVGTNPAVDLTKDQANHINRTLTADWARASN
ncbi:hypothetical protein [Bradyrhizobium sp. Ec3.3]|uniref:hypothetical protein n=1 Tax=Bradyrhizobium sp. Ec3.3 TaxID=189753 RepID=UPI0004230CBA|nr:hypothetical protein [Bradyrhizobium sp. Ec3.3]